MKNPIKYGVIGLLAATLATLQPSQAQNRNLAQPTTPMSAEQRTEQYGPTLSVDFPGGSLEAYVKALQKAAGDKPVNVVVPAAAKKVELPPIALRDVTMYTALSAVSAAFERNSEHEFAVDTVGTSGDAAFAIQYMRTDRGSYVPSKQQPGGVVQAPSRRLEVYSIRDLIEPPAGADGSPQAKVAYESILSAVDAAMGMFDEKEPPKLMFHKDTGLLLVGGTPYQTEVVDNLIRRIRDDLQRRWSEERGTRKQSAEQQRRLALAKTEMQIAEKELALAEEQMGRIKQLVDQGATSREELSQALMNVDRMKAALERRRIEMESVVEGAVEAGKSTAVVYDIKDVIAKNSEVVTLVELVAQNGNAKATVQKDGAGKATGITVEGSESTHATIAKLLQNIRKNTK